MIMYVRMNALSSNTHHLNAADSYLLKQNEIFIGKINFLQFKTRKISISSIVI